MTAEKKHEAVEKPVAETSPTVPEDLKEKYLRALADLDNYKKLMAREREELVKFANEALLRATFPIHDGLERALQSLRGKSETEEVAKGVALVKKQLEDVLGNFGVTQIETQGKLYDPKEMEAVNQKESEQPENTVLEQIHAGFRLNGRVIRPALVVIAKNKEGA